VCANVFILCLLIDIYLISISIKNVNLSTLAFTLDIIDLDQSLFWLINHKFSNPVFDDLFPLFRNKFFWLPLYFFILSFVLINLKSKALLLILALVACVGLTDFISSEIIKKTVKRERPCQMETFKDQINLLAKCGSGYSFTSSHAANHFGLGIMLCYILWNKRKKLAILFILWASLISISQVYVGVHFPLDIIAGALLGLVVASFVLVLFEKLNSIIYINE